MSTVEVLAPNEKRCSKCKEVKDITEFSPIKRCSKGVQSFCKSCGARIALERRQKKLESRNTIPCPICHKGYIWLYVHLLRIHKLTKEEIVKFNTISEEGHEIFTKKIVRTRPSMRKGAVVTIQKNRISFPREYWPDDCRFMRVVVSKKERQVFLRPYLKQHSFTKPLWIEPPGPRGHRIYVNVHHDLLDSLEVERDIELTKRKGFVIKFTDKDDPLLDAFALWALHGQSVRNKANMTTYADKISFSHTVFPEKPDYIYIKLSRAKRSGFDDYLDVYVEPKFNLTGECEKFKVCKKGNRYFISPKRFLSESFIPQADWDLVAKLTSGALRFRLYKEREQIAS